MGATVASFQRTRGRFKSLILNSLVLSQGQFLPGKAISQDSTLMSYLLSCSTWIAQDTQPGCKSWSGQLQSAVSGVGAVRHPWRTPGT